MKTRNSRCGAIRSHWSAAVMALCAMLTAGPALAVDRTWTGLGADDFWASAGNWDTGAPLSTDRLIFAGSTKLTTNSNNLATGTSFGGIRFDAAAGAFTLSGSSLRINGVVEFTANPAVPITQTINHNFLVPNAATLSFGTQPNGTIVVNGAITDGGTDRVVNMGGTGTLTLNAANSFGGQARLNGGTINAKVIADAGVASSLGRANGVTGATTPILRIGNTTATVTLIYTGVSAASTNRQVQVGIGTAVTDIGGATIANNVADSAHTLTFSNAAFNAANTTAIAPRTLTLGGTNTGLNTISGAIIDNAVAAPISLAKADAGTWVLAGANTYTGTTTATNGTLIVNGSLADTVVTVASGATLGGSGTIGTSAVTNTLTVNGALAPGNPTGILTVNDNLDLNGTLRVNFNGTTAGTGHDQVQVNGTVDITGSVLSANFAGFTPANGNLLFIVLNDGADAIAGTFTGFAPNTSVGNLRGFDWVISYTADSTAGTFTGGNDIALMAVPDNTVALSEWSFNSGATMEQHLGSSATVSGLTVSRLNFHPTFDAVGFVSNEQTTLNAFSTHDRWAADNVLGAIRMKRADYLHGSAPVGRSATFNSTTTAISNTADTLGAPIWFSVTAGEQTNATITRIAIANPGASNPATYYFTKSGDALGGGTSDEQAIVDLPAPITVLANQTVFFSINIDSAAVATNHNIHHVHLYGSTVALPPPIGLVTGTLTVGAPHGTFNRMTATLDPGPLGSSTDTTDLTGTINATVNINPATGKTSMLTLSGRVNGTNMDFVKTSIFPALAYNIQATNLSAAIATIAPPGTVNPDTGVFAANQHHFILDQGAFTGTASAQPVNYNLSPTRTLNGIGTGNGSLTLTAAGTSGPYNVFNADVTLPIAVNQTIVISGVNTVVTGTATIKATGQIQMPSSEFNAWLIAQGATTFDATADTAANGAPDGIKWALGLSLFDNPQPYLLKPAASGAFTITLPPGGTVAPLTVQTSTTLLPGSWTTLPAGQMSPAVNPIPAGTTGVIGITPTPSSKIFLRLHAAP